MSMPLNWNRIREAVNKKDSTPALVLDITDHIVNNMLRYHIQITEQKYRGSELYRGSNSFTALNGFTLSSAGCPAGSRHNKGDSENNYHMYVRGSYSNSDNEVIIIYSLGYLEKLKEAVKEYNDLMS